MRSISRLEKSFLILAVLTFIASWSYGIEMFVGPWKQHADEGFVLRLYHTLKAGYTTFFSTAIHHPINPAANIIGWQNNWDVLGNMIWLLHEGHVWAGWPKGFKQSLFIIAIYQLIALGVGFPFYLYLFPKRYFSVKVAAKRKGSEVMMYVYLLFGVLTTFAYIIYTIVPNMRRMGWSWTNLILMVTTFNSTWWFLAYDVLGTLVAYSMFSVYAMHKHGLNGVFFGISMFALNVITGGAGFMWHCAHIEYTALKRRGALSGGSKKRSKKSKKD